LRIKHKSREQKCSRDFYFSKKTGGRGDDMRIFLSPALAAAPSSHRASGFSKSHRENLLRLLAQTSLLLAG
jgi:hypothetical protein